MAVVIQHDQDGGEVFAGTICQIELGMVRAAALGPDDVLVVQWPELVSDQEWHRINTYIKAKIPDRRVVLVGPGVVFGVLNTEPGRDLGPGATVKEKIGEAEAILARTVKELQESVTWAEMEIERLGLGGLAGELRQIKIDLQPADPEGGTDA